MKINNSDELGSSPLRKAALNILEAGLLAIDSGEAVRKNLALHGETVTVADKQYVVRPDSKLIIIGIGKCAIDAAFAAEEILYDKLTAGLVLDVRENNTCPFRKIECFAGTHPMPSDQNVEATKKILNILKDLTEDDLVVFIISGGGSTLLCLPEEGANCIDEKIILGELFEAGANISEINVIRKHMSLARGGYLAKYAYPARVVSLIFSDVPGNDIETVASGPTVKDTSSVADADRLLDKYNVLHKCNIEHCGLIETPKEDKYFQNVSNVLIVSNEHALEAMKEKAESLGFKSEIKDVQIEGEAREVGKNIAKAIKNSTKGTVNLYGGETTVKITGKGRGGRNQELALSALNYLYYNNGDEIEDVLVFSIASDGHDNGPYAGALADNETFAKAKEKNLVPTNFLEENNASEFFEATKDLAISGSTGSNISDIIIAIK